MLFWSLTKPLLSPRRVLSAVLVGLLMCCNSGGDIIGVDGGAQQGAQDRSKTPSNTDQSIANDQTQNMKKSNSNEEDGDDSSQLTDIEYPQLGFNASGFTTCKGDTYQSTASVVTSMDNDKLDLTMTAAKVFCGSRCQEQADTEVQKSIGVTRYIRLVKEEKDKLIKGGLVDAPFAIFGTSVTKMRQNQVFNFDKKRPVPVFPWPAAKSRYEPLDAGPMQWQTTVTGAGNFDIIVKVSKVGESGDIIKLKFETTIVGDTDSTKYEIFPMPRQAIYSVDTVTRDVKQIDSTNLFNGEHCDNRPERVEMVYKVCTKTKKGQTQNFPCS